MPEYFSDTSRWTCSPEHVDLDIPRRFTRRVRLAAQPQHVTLDLGDAAVIVVDMQNDFCHERGWLASQGVDVRGGAGLKTPINAMLDGFRGAQVPIIWLNWGTRSDRANLPPNVLHAYDGEGTGGGIGESVSLLSNAVLTANSWGAAILDGLVVDDIDIHVNKHRMSGFWEEELDSILRNLGVRHLFLCGVNVDQCVYATLIDAACAGYDCLLITDASATTSPSYCTEATIYNVRQCFGFTCDTAAIRASLHAPTEPHGVCGTCQPE
ncbi:cysteine hydrolase family protein [Mycobacterium marinum]|uniref:cysteine hydrolase family protein n=1 Tax=Mycobacterium marinum TaxID=1781 RepID=UPI0035696535